MVPLMKKPRGIYILYMLIAMQCLIQSVMVSSGSRGNYYSFLYHEDVSFQNKKISFEKEVKSDSNSFQISDDQFILDGEAFQILSGSLHYFRIHPELWMDRLQRLKALGLNSVDIYIPWNIHEPYPGQYQWTEGTNIQRFLHLVSSLNLKALVRIGPYICGEWTFGGFPWWLGSPTVSYGGKMRLRSSDPAFLDHVDRWWYHLLPRLKPYLHSHGGPIIMMQIENEYGSCGNDAFYLTHLKEVVEKVLGASLRQETLLYTTDSPRSLPYGSLSGGNVLTTVDFGPGWFHPAKYFKIQKSMNEPGKSPPMCSEFYSGWLTHWGEAMANTSAVYLAQDTEKLLLWTNNSVNINFYMAHGGTNFGFNAGANIGSDGKYLPHITSYDYHAPISESGDYCQPGIGGDGCKYRMIRNAIAKSKKVPLKALPPIPPRPKIRGYGQVHLHPVASLLGSAKKLAEQIFEMEIPTTFEMMDQSQGIAIYSCYIQSLLLRQPEALLDISMPVHDYATIFLDGRKVASIDRNGGSHVQLLNLPQYTLGMNENVRLDIVVEAMGRQNFGCNGFGSWDFKGLQSNLVHLNGVQLKNWKVFNFELKDVSFLYKDLVSTDKRWWESLRSTGRLLFAHFIRLFRVLRGEHQTKIKQKVHNIDEYLSKNGEGPRFFHGTFNIEGKAARLVTDAGGARHLACTYLDVSKGGWKKGIAWINNFNLGWYWPEKGPQMSLYVPGPILRPGRNDIVFLEVDGSYHESGRRMHDAPVELTSVPHFINPMNRSM